MRTSRVNTAAHSATYNGSRGEGSSTIWSFKTSMTRKYVPL